MAFSGRYDLTLNVNAFHDQLGGYYDDNFHFHTPSHFLRNLNCEQRLVQLRHMDIVMAFGHEAPFLQNNLQLSQSKGVRNQLHLWDGRDHGAGYWRRMAPMYL